MPNFVSLFAGAGGFDVGFHAAGFQCLAQVEINATARDMLARHWPDVPRYSDVCEFGAKQVPHADVVVGGFPCQDLSVAGHRKGFGGDRSSLFFEMCRVVSELKPAFVVFENVPGLLSGYDEVSDDDATGGERGTLGKPPGKSVRRWWMGTVLRNFSDLGYSGCYRVLDARHFGVPQSRRRVFGVFARVASVHSGTERCREILALSESLRGDSQAGGEAGPRPPASVEGRADDDCQIAPALRASGVGTERIGDTRGQDCIVLAETQVVAPCLRSNQFSNSDPSQEARMLVFGGAASGERGGNAAIQAKNTRQDFDTENLVAYQCHGTNIGPLGTVRQGNGGVTGGVPFVFNAKQSGEGSEDVSPALLAMPHDASHANAGGQLAVMIRTAQTSANGIGVQEDAAYTLDGANAQAVCIPIDMRQASRGEKMTNNRPGGSSGGAPGTGIGEEGDPSPTLGLSHPPAVCVTGSVTHTLTSEGADASEDGTGRGTPIISFQPNDPGSHNNGTSPSLRAGAGGGSLGSRVCVTVPMVAGLVRRLTPLECERLMGWPDQWTRYRADGTEISDGPRYRLCGNGVVGTVSTWLARRMMRVLSESANS